MDEIGQWYESKRREASELLSTIEIVKRQLAEAVKPRTIAAVSARLKRLERELEQARYVGD